MTLRTSVDMSADNPFKAYRERFSARPYLKERVSNDGELVRLEPTDGVQEFPSIENPETGSPPSLGTEKGRNTYLWVVLPDSAPIILEDSPSSQNLQSKRITHTNLTGGADAHAGGELWFYGDSSTILFSGASGRYQPRNPEELTMVGAAFKACGYVVGSLGWDADRARPFRNLRGTPDWL